VPFYLTTFYTAWFSIRVRDYTGIYYVLLNLCFARHYYSGFPLVKEKHLFIYLFIHSFIHPSIHSFIHSFFLSFFRSFVRSATLSVAQTTHRRMLEWWISSHITEALAGICLEGLRKVREVEWISRHNDWDKNVRRIIVRFPAGAGCFSHYTASLSALLATQLRISWERGDIFSGREASSLFPSSAKVKN
jgi:hypothetical protein